ncbi:MAG: NAD(+) diphosphatase [Burkholderiales bacterium]|nr:NAD(+) diphosphatase [Burkholderiales bacterium]
MFFEQPEQYFPGFAPPQQHPERAHWFVFRRSQLLVREGDERADLPLAATLDSLGLAPLRVHYLGRLAEQHCFAAEVEQGADAPPGWTFCGLRALFSGMAPNLLGVAGRALQIVDWDRTHQFCGACGLPTRPSASERSRECVRCGLVAYPQISPVVMCLIRRGSELLLARSPRFAKGVYSALAGFVEPGETLEQCARREVEEEVGLQISNLRYFASQPWPFPHSLMIAFLAEHAGGEIRIDGVEIEDAQWFSCGNPPALPARISIARKLIDAAIGEITGQI